MVSKSSYLDPVSYRVEPMIDNHIASKKPEMIPYTKGGLTGISTNLTELGSGIMGNLLSMSNLFSSNVKVEDDKSIPVKEVKDDFATKGGNIKLLNPRGRIDYSLQAGVIDNAYLSALSVHMGYWVDIDVSLFILKELYGV